MPRPCPLVFLVITSGLFLCGCDAPVVTGPGSVTPALSHAAQLPASVPTRADLKPFGLAWESEWTMDGEITGIESSTDLVHWQVETQWVMQSDWPASVIVLNTWTDTQPGASQKFYRAFNRGP